MEYKIKPDSYYVDRYGIPEKLLKDTYKTPHDNYLISNIMLTELGKYSFAPPPGPTLRWGLITWLKYVIGG